GQHRGRAVAQGRLQDADHVGVEEGLAAGEVILLHPQAHLLVGQAQDRVEVEVAEGVVVGATADEAVPAGEVAEGAGDLEPQLVEVGEGHHGGGLVEDRQGDGHGKEATTKYTKHTKRGGETTNHTNKKRRVGRVFEAHQTYLEWWASKTRPTLHLLSSIRVIRVIRGFISSCAGRSA